MWNPMKTLPKEGKFLLAMYAPTNWTYWINTVVFHADESARMRENKLKYARAWMHMSFEPEEDINDL